MRIVLVLFLYQDTEGCGQSERVTGNEVRVMLEWLVELSVRNEQRKEDGEERQRKRCKGGKLFRFRYLAQLVGGHVALSNCFFSLCVYPGLYLDAQAAMDFLLTCRDIDRRKIIVFGRSLGGAVAISLAASPTYRDK